MGKRRLEAALAAWSEKHPGEAKPAVRWLPFQLNPDLPASGMPRREYIERKWGPGRGPQVYSRVAAAGQTVDIPFAFESITVQPNTLDAHRLLTFGEREGRQNELAEELFKAYFIEGANLTDRSILADIAARAGLDRGGATAYLESGADRDLVLRGDVEAREAGISGVPFFIFNRRVGVSGAQEPGALLQAMEQSMREKEPGP
ncbi:MAG TPA: DsbA family oxidoreductase [Burkholderiales bacterium]|nr:DsbA family oxidoreductase [Burkholderiales bacterium]